MNTFIEVPNKDYIHNRADVDVVESEFKVQLSKEALLYDNYYKCLKRANIYSTTIYFA